MEDRCNICLEHRRLTWDHVPPRGINPVAANRVEMMPSVDLSGGLRARESQNGLKFRTLCRECNSFLGTRYDHVIVDFTRSVRTYSEAASVHLPSPVVHHPVKVQRLMKGILGHLLAAKPNLDEATFDQTTRKYVLEEEESLPENLHLFYWTYLYDVIQVRRDFLMSWVSGTHRCTAGFSTLKFRPIGYIVSDTPQYAGLCSLSKYRDLEIDDEVEIPIDIRCVHDKDWPDVPDEDRNVVIVGDSGLRGIEARGRPGHSKRR